VRVREEGEELVRPIARTPVGSFRYTVAGDRWEWSDEAARMHGYEPGTVCPTAELAGLLEQLRQRGSPVSSRHRVTDTHGHERLVMVVADQFCDDGGALAGITGFCLDVTDQVNDEIQAQVSESVRAVSARRAVINQAMGALMLRYGLTADSAFLLLARLSQESNVKVRVLAERVVASTAARGKLPDDVADRAGIVLREAAGHPHP
jgi:hypothetical protein